MNILVWILVVAALVLLVGYTVLPRYFGFRDRVVKKTETYKYNNGEAGPPIKTQETKETQTTRTVWDWLAIVTISAVLALIAFLYTRSQNEQQRFIQDQQAKDQALLAYLDNMSQLIFDRGLQTSKENTAVRDVARARTLVGLLSVGPERKRHIVRFLYESDLLKSENPENRSIVDLTEANLTDADLRYSPLGGIDLRGANLSDGPADTNSRGANLEGANLEGANLEGANLEGANLERAVLKGATMPTGQKYEERRKDNESRMVGE